MLQRLRETLYFFKSNLAAIAVLVLAIHLPLEALHALFQNVLITEDASPAMKAFPPLLAVFVAPVSSAALILLLQRLLVKKDWSVAALVGAGINLWGRLMATSIMAGVLIVVGLLAFVVPGVYLFSRLAFVEFAVVLEGRDPVAAIKRSFKLTRGREFEILLPLAALLAGIGGLQWLIMEAIAFMGLTAPVVKSAATLLFTVLGSLFMILLFRLYQVAGEAEGEQRGKELKAQA